MAAGASRALPFNSLGRKKTLIRVRRIRWSLLAGSPALGASIVVPTPDGKKIKVKVPAGTQDGKVLTIKGKGAPDLKNKGQFGNLKIQIHVEVPTDMNDEQKKAMEDFLAATGEEKRPWA